jgi:alcohol dehydrogenase (cytochrome c)
VYRGDARKGTNLYTASIVALNADTGKMAWYFQSSPHDTHDWDATQVPILFDATFNGQRRQLLAQASRNGIFFLLDRATGQNLMSVPYIESANLVQGLRRSWPADPESEKEASKGGALVSPNNGGGQNWAPPTYDPETGLIYMNAAQGYEIHYKWDVDGPTFGSAGHAAHAVGGLDTSLRAFDPLTGKSRWIHKYQGTEWNPPRPELLGGLLSTAGRLVFAGAPGNFIVALRPGDGSSVVARGLHRADEQHTDHLYVERPATARRCRR